MATTETTSPSGDLPLDNATRVAFYDALHDGATFNGSSTTVTEDELFDRVIPRLRVLVPRELHLAGEREYVAAKTDAYVQGGLLFSETGTDGRRTFRLSGLPPQIRYPDGEIKDYPAGLESARERLDRVNSQLRDAGFDVLKLIPTVADEPNSPEYRLLVESMREHGFLRQFWIAEMPDGTVIDGRARKRAAESLGLKVPTVTYPPGREREAIRRRDTPLNRVAIVIDSNRARLRDEQIAKVHDEIARIAGRDWHEIASDLALTREWRQAVPKDYVPMFDVTTKPFRDDGTGDVQITDDNRVMLRSLIVASGLSSYKTKTLEQYVPMEMARTKHSSRKALFAKAEDIVAGIDTMKKARAAAKIEPQWDEIRAWLAANANP